MTSILSPLNKINLQTVCKVLSNWFLFPVIIFPKQDYGPKNNFFLHICNFWYQFGQFYENQIKKLIMKGKLFARKFCNLLFVQSLPQRRWKISVRKNGGTHAKKVSSIKKTLLQIPPAQLSPWAPDTIGKIFVRANIQFQILTSFPIFCCIVSGNRFGCNLLERN